MPLRSHLSFFAMSVEHCIDCQQPKLSVRGGVRTKLLRYEDEEEREGTGQVSAQGT